MGRADRGLQRKPSGIPAPSRYASATAGGCMPLEPAAPPAPALNRYQLSERPSNISSFLSPHSPPRVGQQIDEFAPLTHNSEDHNPVNPRLRSLSPPPSNVRFAVPPPLMSAPFGATTATDEGKGHVRRRSIGGAGSEEDYGPLGPLGSTKPPPLSSRPRRI